MRLVLVSLALLLGCERVESTDIRTSGIYADLSLEARGDGETSVWASLRVGGALSNTYLELIGNDHLKAHQGEDTNDMERRSIPLGPVSYRTSFDVDAENTPFRINFERDPHSQRENCGDTSAPNSFATLPAPFGFDGPEKNSEHSRADDLEILYSPIGSSDAMSWSISGACIESASGTISGDSGRVMIPRGQIKAIQMREAEKCDVTVEIVRSRAGMVDPAYGEGGSFRARQVRTLSLSSVP